MSAFSGHYPYTAGPNDAPPIPLTPQQLALAYHHFQFMQQNTMPPPPPPPPQAPVIDPALQVQDPNTNTQRLEALERESRSSLLKTTQKSDAYLLRDAKGLSVKQEEVRKKLMKKMKTELMTLTGMARDANSESDSDSESSSAPPARPSRSKADTFSLLHKDVKFTLADIASFGKTNFRTSVEAKPTQSTSGVQEKAQENPAFILETDWMSDEISGRIPTTSQEGHPSKANLCGSVSDPDSNNGESTQKKKSRQVVQRLNLGNLHSRIPAGTLWPFMIRQDWYDETLAVNAELESALSLYTKNPEGFGDELDDGYGGDDEGGHA
ncbi:hypothetical protein B0H17DRAFT_1145804 [Mycena rosella]|uniref:Uncharacterized protein n=1 Tax=Mycena rosella TaxID=1033263 RepID=A0AAD7G560_MYCRO|nr:hypothetical protein B0H17DRAFT_1145804 [Mycena rosella]